MEWDERSIDVDGLAIHVRRTGSGDEPWVLLHGFGDNGRCWGRVAEALTERATSWCVDARNHGLSGTGPGGPDGAVADVLGVLRALDLDAPTLMGHSLGARTAAAVAVAAPDLVGRLVLVDPPWRDAPAEPLSDERRAGVVAMIEHLRSQTADELAELARTQHGDWDPVDHEPWIESKQQIRPEAADDMAPVEWRAIAEALTMPTLLLHGDVERGGIVTDAVAAVAAQNAAVSSVRIPDAGHNIHRENHTDFLRAVSTFAGTAVSAR